MQRTAASARGSRSAVGMAGSLSTGCIALGEPRHPSVPRCYRLWASGNVSETRASPVAAREQPGTESPLLPSPWLSNASACQDIPVGERHWKRTFFRKMQMSISSRWRLTGYSGNNITRITKPRFSIILTFKPPWISQKGLQEQRENWEGQVNAPSRIKSQLTRHQWRRTHFTWSIKRLPPIDLCS